RDDGQTVLEQLERANLFLIPLDERRQWYRYHHLFADLLRQRLTQEKPSECAPLQRRASRWYDRQGLAYEAVEHARQADDPAWLTELVERWGEELLKRSELDTLREWVSLLPESSLEQQPLLAILDSWCALFGSAQQLELSLNRSQTTLANSTHLDAYQRARLQGHWASIRAFAIAREGNPQQGVALAEQALAQLPEDENLVRAPLALSVGSGYGMIGNLDKAQAALTQAQQAGEQSGSFFALIGAMACQGELDRARGRFRDGIRICREAIELAQRKGCTLVLGYTRAALARLHMDRWELQEAQAELEQAIDLIKLLGDVPCLGVNRAWLARLKLALGDPAGAADALAQAVDLAEKADWSEDTRLEVRAHCALAELAHSHTVTHRQWLGDNVLAEFDPAAFYHQTNLVRIKFAIRQGHCAEALPALESLIERADLEQRQGHALEWRILQAAALLGAGREQAALAAFEHSVARARPEGFLRAFAEDWDLLEPLAIRLSDGRKQFCWGALNRLAPSPVGPTPVALPGQAARPPLLDPMSSRELEVLCWVAQGLSNRAIAEKLFVSVGTVKTHLHHILAKLAVGNRTEAVHRARSLGLIA
ncbi:MAG: LuxR C-terminal-related transcriptional regulator, partial [Candidatus Competibacteraceae bacterium]